MNRNRGTVAVLSLFAAGAFAAVSAAQVTTTPTPSPANARCPVMIDEPVDPAFTTTYQGKVIGFCCDKCLAKFVANPDRYAARLAGLLDGKPKTPADHQPAPDTSHSPNETRTGDDDVHPAQEHNHAEDDHAGTMTGESPDEGHRHEHSAEQREGFVFRLIAWLGKFHPPAVNFPIAMISGAALAELLLIRTGKPLFGYAGRFCLWVGALGAVGAGVLGWFFAGFHLVDESWNMTTHRWLGTTTAAWSVVILVVGERMVRRADARRTTYRTVLFIGATLVGVTGFFGGSLIYGLTHYAW